MSLAISATSTLSSRGVGRNLTTLFGSVLALSGMACGGDSSAGAPATDRVGAPTSAAAVSKQTENGGKGCSAGGRGKDGKCGKCGKNDDNDDNDDKHGKCGKGGASASCAGLAPTCGPAGNTDCCVSTVVTGGTFNLGRKSGDPDDAPSGLSVGSDETPSVAATVASYRLDDYEVTVGRFRKFVAAYDAWRAAGNPAAGAGKHTYLPGGGLNAGAETGWDTSWNDNLPADATAWGDTSHLACFSTFETWTPDSTGGHESRPINCVDWYESYAFCVWDGGFLPSEAEWEHAAAGGGEERVFPWSTPDPSSVTIDCSYANYGSPGYCVASPTGSTSNVGSVSPKGDGKYGQADLAGNVWEWVLDGYAAYPGGSCENCADLQIASRRVLRGGSFLNSANFVRAAARIGVDPTFRGGDFGVRCARRP